MWNPEKVERALFTWPKWRKSVLREWINPTAGLDKLRLRRIRKIAGTKTSEMGFPKSVLLEMYWFCCVLSDYSMDNWTTFDRIVMPAWLPSLYDSILRYDFKPGSRMYPPRIIDEGDLSVLHKQLFGTYTGKPDYGLVPREKSDRVFLTSEHELYRFLNEFKGRTRKRLKPLGRYPKHSDRMAVTCYRLKQDGATNVQIAERFGLRIEDFVTFNRSSAAMHLVRRGEKLALKVEDQRLQRLLPAFGGKDSGYHQDPSCTG